MSDRLPNPHPGEILALEFLQPMDLAAADLADALHLSLSVVQEVLRGERSISADIDLRLARYFRVSEGMFLAMQADHDLMARKRELGPALDAIRPRAA